MSRTSRRLRLCLALLAWFAQLCLPLAHAAIMAQPPASMAGWCGDLARAQAFLAELPPELQPTADADASGVHALDACAELCGVATTPAPLPAPAPAAALRAAGLALVPALVQPVLAPHEPALKPPSQGPPTGG